uniref:Uncharacterized protein n=1 Tax=Poecilia formosa TaxID=48698 RepID=A0A096MH22_POEFO
LDNTKLGEHSEMIRINNTQYFHFLQQADVLRQSGSLCDAIISVQSQTFRAHRLVLACASRALAQHLAKSDADSPAHCTLEYFSPHTFQQVLDFIYTQALEVPVKDLQQLLRAAQVLEMQLLEDQCRKQLDRLEAREKDKNGEAVDLTEEEKSVEEKNQKQKSRPVSESKVQKTSSPVEKPSFGIVMESASIADSADVPANQQSPKRKAKLSPISATLCNRDSVITRPNSSGSSFSSAWAFPTNMWDNGNHLNTLMRIAGNYSNFFASHPLPSSNQTSVTPLQSTALGYSRLHPHPYAQNLYTETSRMGSMIKNGILKRKKLSLLHFPARSVSPVNPSLPHQICRSLYFSHDIELSDIRRKGSLRIVFSNFFFHAISKLIFSNKSTDFCLWHRCLICTVPSAGLKQTKYASRSYPEVPKVRERADGCQHCSSRLLCDPLLRESASTQLADSSHRICKEACASAWQNVGYFESRHRAKHWTGNTQATDARSLQVAFFRVFNLKNHTFCKRFLRRYACKGDRKVFLHMPTVQNHIKPGTGQNCDGCQFCGRDAVQHAANARDHRGEKPYQCKHCPKKFSLKHQLDTHHRVHTGEKPFECRLCGQRSRDYSAMIKHLRTHGGAAPYQCTVCLEFCSSLVAMQRHIKSHAVQDFPPDWSINNTYLYISHI